MGRIAPTAGIRQFQSSLLRWYRKHGRHDLPWRNTHDAYEIYISEIMLQQTQVETVRERFYTPFLKQFPTLKHLAEADSEQVLSLWQGLGYYRRARYLYAAAHQAKGVMPDSVEGLMALPGIGRNTAHAVAAFGYHHPVAVMEANVKRIICRIFAISSPAEKELWEKAELLLNKQEPFDHNQAMMDLGAMICTPTNPRCPECPANRICQGKNQPELYPAAKLKKTIPVRVRHIIVQMDGARKFKASARQGEFLHGLYQFTEQEHPPAKTAVTLGDIQQVYSHFKLQATIYLERSKKTGGNDYYTLAQLRELPMSMAEKKILQLLSSHVKAKP